jgi:predicted aminopeptidase
LSGCFFSSCYLTRQAWGLIQQRQNAVPLADLARKNDLRPELRQLIERVDRIRDYGIREIGLKDSDNYRSMVDLPQDYLMTAVSACRPLSFERYTWWFPFFGNSPYLGFFDDADARAEADRLKKEGWETWVRHVDGFSTLGILRDPLFSFMAKFSEYQLANLILHEQTHATIWSGGHFDFNEQLATFTGDWCALAYIERTYGRDSPEYRAVGDEDADVKTFYADLADLRSRLSTVYAGTGSDAQKTAAKAETIRQWQEGFRQGYASRYRSDRFVRLSDMQINNAFLDLYQTYTGRNILFRQFFDQSASMPDFLRRMKQAAATADPMAWMEKELQASHNTDRR